MQTEVELVSFFTENAPSEYLYVKLDLRNTKWLLNYSYNLPKSMIEKHLSGLSEYLDLYSLNYEKKVLC